MKRTILGFALMAALAAVAQPPQNEYAFDNLRLSQTELRGTSRFQSMAGAFGALGGDISSLNQNPAGIGVYRSSDVGITLSLDFNQAVTPSLTEKQTRFNVNNVGYVGAVKFGDNNNFNWGISYNRLMDFHRRYRGAVEIPTSITNYLAEKMMAKEIYADDILVDDPFAKSSADWNHILAFNNYLVIPTNYEGSQFAGLGFDGVTALGEYDMDERGRVDEFAINFGGGIANTLCWGIGLGITDMKYEYNQYYGESLYGTEVYDVPDDPEAVLVDGDMDLGFTNWSQTKGTGYNLKLGVIVKPINELRFGVAFHTPTYYKLTDRFSQGLATAFYPQDAPEYQLEDGTDIYRIDYDLRTPWRFIGSVATVIGSKAILSADYEYVATDNIRVKDEWEGNYNHFTENRYTTDDVKAYLQGQHIIRLGGELRLTPNWSLRAGYSYQTGAAKSDVKDDKVDVNVCGVSTAYTYDNKTQYMTAGIGYRHNHFYFDMAYVHKYRNSNYHLFPGINDLPTVYDEVKDHNNRFSATIGFRF